MAYNTFKTVLLASTLLSSACHAVRPGSGRGSGSGAVNEQSSFNMVSDAWYQALISQSQDMADEICPPCINLASRSITYNPAEIKQKKTNRHFIKLYTRVVRQQFSVVPNGHSLGIFHTNRLADGRVAREAWRWPSSRVRAPGEYNQALRNFVTSCE